MHFAAFFQILWQTLLFPNQNSHKLFGLLRALFHITKINLLVLSKIIVKKRKVMSNPGTVNSKNINS